MEAEEHPKEAAALKGDASSAGHSPLPRAGLMQFVEDSQTETSDPTKVSPKKIVAQIVHTLTREGALPENYELPAFVEDALGAMMDHLGSGVTMDPGLPMATNSEPLGQVLRDVALRVRFFLSTDPGSDELWDFVRGPLRATVRYFEQRAHSREELVDVIVSALRPLQDIDRELVGATLAAYLLADDLERLGPGAVVSLTGLGAGIAGASRRGEGSVVEAAIYHLALCLALQVTEHVSAVPASRDDYLSVGVSQAANNLGGWIADEAYNRLPPGDLDSPTFEVVRPLLLLEVGFEVPTPIAGISEAATFLESLPGGHFSSLMMLEDRMDRFAVLANIARFGIGLAGTHAGQPALLYGVAGATRWLLEVDNAAPAFFNSGVQLARVEQFSFDGVTFRRRASMNLLGLLAALSEDEDVQASMYARDGLKCLVNLLGTLADPHLRDTIEPAGVPWARRLVELATAYIEDARARPVQLASDLDLERTRGAISQVETELRLASLERIGPRTALDKAAWLDVLEGALTDLWGDIVSPPVTPVDALAIVSASLDSGSYDPWLRSLISDAVEARQFPVETLRASYERYVDSEGQTFWRDGSPVTDAGLVDPDQWERTMFRVTRSTRRPSGLLGTLTS